ncbi:MAG TPA: DUF177 domain-containing protein [Oscillospiraceae bacterium]|nr:DUF177 domain-containing protein [Oscillospiraceae bacterium]
MRLDLSQIIEIPGGSVPFSCVLDTGDLDFEQVKAYRSAPHAEGCVRNTAGILELTGTIEAAMKCVCDRCGGEYDTVKETALSALLSEDDSEEDDPDVFPLEGDSIDLTEILRTLFILDMDSKFLCSPDCRGLCPVCGKNLNLGPCGCGKETDPRMAVLEQLLDKEDK